MPMMVSDPIKQELDELRAQLDELRREREDQQLSGEDRPGNVETEKGSPAPGEPLDVPVEEGIGSDLMGQLKELLDDLDEELKEVNPTTLLAVFALGIVMGRLLPR